MATVGVAVSLGDKIALDLAWRHTDYGAVKTGKATGRIEYRDGRATVSTLPRSNQGRSAAPRLGPFLALRILRTSFPLCPQQQSVAQPCRRAEHQRIAGCAKTPSERSNDPPDRHSRESGNPGGVEWENGAWGPLQDPWIPAFAGMTEGRGNDGGAFRAPKLGF